MACNVGQYILSADDRVDDEVEAIVHNCSGREAIRSRPKRRKQGFLLPRHVKLGLIGGWPPLSQMVISGYETFRGDIYIDLRYGDKVLRKLHTHDCHRNPGGCLIPGTHMHFPSVRYPLKRDYPSYAYEVELPSELKTLEEGILTLCELLGISGGHIQGKLGW